MLTDIYTIHIIKKMKLRWNPEKNELLKKTRNVSFEQVAEKILQQDFLGPVKNPSRENQKIITVVINDYPCIVPLVVEEDGSWFLKTIYQSRKEKRRLKNGI